MESFWQDVRYGFRMLAKTPGLTAIVVITLALGIGANSTVFSWINATLLDPIPGAVRSREIFFVARGSTAHAESLSYPDFVDLRERNRVFSGVMASAIWPMSLTDKGNPERLWGSLVTSNYFDVLGVRPILGRGFLPDEEKTPGGASVAVLSYRLWQGRFGGNPSVVGQSISLNSHPFTIVGVAPPEFQGSNTGLRVEIWVPVVMASQITPYPNILSERENSWLNGFGRIAPGVSHHQAQAGWNTAMQQIVRQYPDDHSGLNTILLIPLWKAPGANSFLGPVLIILLVISGVVLLLACANVTNLLLARGVSRQRELAIRLSLGASRARLIRQLLTESVLLALLGGAVALLFTLWTSKSFLYMVPPSNLPIWLHVGVDQRVLFASLAVAMFTGLLFGVLPALRASGMNPAGVLKDESGSVAGGGRRSRLIGALAVAQIALSFLMLVCAGLLILSFRNALGFDPGFNPRNVLVASYDLFPKGLTPQQGVQFHQRILEEITAKPGVLAASLCDWVPLGFSSNSDSFVPEGYQPAPHETMEAGVARISPGYLRTMQIPLLAGRDFGLLDTSSSPKFVIINQALAQKYWPGQDAQGKRIHVGGDWVTVIGVARTSKYYDLNERPQSFVYFPLYQSYLPAVTLHVRSSGEPAKVAMAIEDAIHTMSPGLPLFDIGTLANRIQVASGLQRIAGTTVGVFGLLALILGAVGIYGVIAYSTKQRTHEIGIRLALGAQPRDVLRLVLRQGSRLALTGVVVGLVVALAATRLMASVLFGVSAYDPATFAAVVLLLVGVTLAACYIPARRATRIDPIVALRYE